MPVIEVIAFTAESIMELSQPNSDNRYPWDEWGN